MTEKGLSLIQHSAVWVGGAKSWQSSTRSRIAPYEGLLLTRAEGWSLSQQESFIKMDQHHPSNRTNRRNINNKAKELNFCMKLDKHHIYINLSENDWAVLSTLN